jgi:hypothetical protein
MKISARSGPTGSEAAQSPSTAQIRVTNGLAKLAAVTRAIGIVANAGDSSGKRRPQDSMYG